MKESLRQDFFGLAARLKAQVPRRLATLCPQYRAVWAFSDGLAMDLSKLLDNARRLRAITQRLREKFEKTIVESQAEARRAPDYQADQREADQYADERARPCQRTPPDLTAALAAERNGRMARILIAEDNTDAGTMLVKWLEFDGHTVLAVTTGAEALAKAEEFRPDVVTIDIGLPDMDGFDVISQLRRTRSDLLIICAAGNSEPEAVAKSHEAGCDHHLMKPLDLTAVTAIIRGWRPER